MAKCGFYSTQAKDNFDIKPTTATYCIFITCDYYSSITHLFSNKVDSDHDDKYPHNDVVHSLTDGCMEEDTHDPDQYNKAGCTCAFHMTVSTTVTSHSGK